MTVTAASTPRLPWLLDVLGVMLGLCGAVGLQVASTNWLNAFFQHPRPLVLFHAAVPLLSCSEIR